MSDGMEDLPLFSRLSDQTPGVHPATGILRPETSLSAAINAWGEHLEATGASIHTVKAFTSDLRLLAKFVGGGTDLSAIGTHDLKNFLQWMQDRRGVPCSPKTYARRVTSLKSFFRWLVESGVLRENPAGPVPQQTVLSPLPEVLAPEEVQAVLDAARAMRKGEQPDARPYTLVALLLESGIKKSECLAIHLNHIDLMTDQGAILFVRYADVRKRYRERKLPLSDEWVSYYRNYLAQYQPRERLFPYSPRRLEYLLEEIGELAGLEKHLSFNMCRWTAALSDYLAGKDKNEIRQKLGLSKIQWREVGNKLDRLASQFEARPPEAAG
jgi:integrase/recombinase XerD